MKVRVAESGSPIPSADAEPTPKKLPRFPRHASPPSPSPAMKKIKKEPNVKAERVVLGELLMNTEMAVEAEARVKLEPGLDIEPFVKTEPGREIGPSLSSETVVETKAGGADEAGTFTRTLNSIRSRATRSIQDAATVQRLMANYITLNTANGGGAQTSGARQVEQGCVQVARACYAIAGMTSKIIASAAGKDQPAGGDRSAGGERSQDVHLALTKMSELCAGAHTRIVVVERMIDEVSAEELRVKVARVRAWAVRERLESIREGIECLSA